MARRRHTGPSTRELIAQSDGELYFAGVPGAFCPRDLFAGAAELLGHTLPSPSRFEPAAALEDFAAHLPPASVADPVAPSTAAHLLLPGYQVPANAERLERELTRVDDIPITDGAGRLFRFATHLVGWTGNDARCDQLTELLGKLALERICREEAWRNIAVKIDGQLRPLFHSGNHFVSEMLRMRERCPKKSRVSHIRNSARLWLQLHSRGLPVPMNLRWLECFGRHPNAIPTYATLVQSLGGRLPSAQQMQAAAAQMRAEHATALAAAGEHSPGSTHPRPLSMEEKKRALRQGIRSYIAANHNDPFLESLIAQHDQLEDADDEDAVVEDTPSFLPRYPAGLPSPFEFSETEEAGSVMLHLTIAPLPDPVPYRMRSSINDHPDWSFTAHPDGGGGGVLHIPLSLHPLRANEQRSQAYSWATNLCLELVAPLPRGVKPRPRTLVPPSPAPLPAQT